MRQVAAITFRNLVTADRMVSDRKMARYIQPPLDKAARCGANYNLEIQVNSSCR